MLENFLVAIALCSFAAWLYLFFFRGNFWKSDQIFRGDSRPPKEWPAVAVVIPARDEAETIAATLTSLAEQDYPGEFRIFLVDDQSSDGTRDVARGVAEQLDRVEIIAGQPLAEGWAGKMWAVAQGIKAAHLSLPGATYLLLTDADIKHPRSNLRLMVAEAEADHLGLLSQMVALNCQSGWERLLIPAFIFFFQKLYPFGWINDPNRSTAGAAGGCMLVQRSALEDAGGIDAIRDQVIDDCALAAAIKPHAPIKLYLSGETVSQRAYTELDEIWHMVRRTAFVQLRHSALAVVGTVVAMFLIYWGPPVTAAWGALLDNSQIWVPGLAAWVLMSLAYMPTVMRYRLPGWRAFSLPVAGLLYILMTVDSARLHLAGRAPEWKGRRYRHGSKEVST